MDKEKKLREIASWAVERANEIHKKENEPASFVYLTDKQMDYYKEHFENKDNG